MLDANISVQTPFFIFFPERSGSTFLVHLLNNHPDVFCEHEVFSTVRVPGKPNEFVPEITEPSQKTQLLEKIYSYQKATASGFKFKFKIQYQHYPEIYRFFLRHIDRMKMIFLYRKNLLKMAISRQNLVRLQEMGEQHFLAGDSPKSVGKLKLDLKKARAYIRRQTDELDFFLRATEVFPNRLVVSYEELCQDTNGWLQKIFRFLDVKPLPNLDQAPIRKITEDSLDKAVENYDEMVEFFSRTRFASFLDTGEPSPAV